jgi:hypothetical protein
VTLVQHLSPIAGHILHLCPLPPSDDFCKPRPQKSNLLVVLGATPGERVGPLQRYQDGLEQNVGPAFPPARRHKYTVCNTKFLFHL